MSQEDHQGLRKLTPKLLKNVHVFTGGVTASDVPSAPPEEADFEVKERPQPPDEPVMEHNYAERPAESPPPSESESNIRIKLKYLNDDLKLVDGRLEELLGDFKR